MVLNYRRSENVGKKYSNPKLIANVSRNTTVSNNKLSGALYQGYKPQPDVRLILTALSCPFMLRVPHLPMGSTSFVERFRKNMNIREI